MLAEQQMLHVLCIFICTGDGIAIFVKFKKKGEEILHMNGILSFHPVKSNTLSVLCIKNRNLFYV